MGSKGTEAKGFVICLLLLASVANGYVTDFDDDIKWDYGGSYYTSLGLPAGITESVDYKFPTADATYVGRPLISDGAGNLSWGGLVTISGTLQFEDSASIMGLVWWQSSTNDMWFENRTNGADIHLATVNGDIISHSELLPFVDNDSDVGSSAKRWKDIYISNNLSDGTYSLTVANALDGYDHIVTSGASHTYISHSVTNTADVTHNDLTLTGTLDVTGVTTLTGLATGGRTDYDLKVGDTTTPDYGMIQIGDSVFGRTSYTAGQIDLVGTVFTQNKGGPVTGNIEFIWVESTGDSCRLAIPKSGEGLATYHPRSLLIWGPAPADTNFVMVDYHQKTNNVFHNLDCNTGVTGADVGIQNDLEVEGDIFVDSIKESTTNAGITFNTNLIVDSDIGVAPDPDLLQLTINNVAVNGTLDATGLVGDTLTMDLTQNYLFTEQGNALAIQSRTAATTSAIDIFSRDGDGTDAVAFSLYGIGTPSSIDPRERLLLSYNVAGPDFSIFTETLNGTVRPFRLGTGANSTQLVLNIDGSIDIGGDLTLNGNYIINGTTIANDGTEYFSSLTGTLPASPSANVIGSFFDYTSAGTGTKDQYGFWVNLEDGFTGNASTAAITAANFARGTKGTILKSGSPWGNAAMNYATISNTVGYNYGVAGYARTGNVTIGGVFRAGFQEASNHKSGAIYIGTMGIARNTTAGGGMNIGGYFGLDQEDPTFESAALIADNETATVPIFLARDDGTAVFTIADGGNVTMGGLHLSIITKTDTDYTLTKNDDTVLFDTGAATRTATLPAASTVTGKIYHIKKIDAGVGFVTIDGNASETIDGDLTPDITTQYETVTIQSDGSNWHIL